MSVTYVNPLDTLFQIFSQEYPDIRLVVQHQSGMTPVPYYINLDDDGTVFLWLSDQFTLYQQMNSVGDVLTTILSLALRDKITIAQIENSTNRMLKIASELVSLPVVSKELH